MRKTLQQGCPRATLQQTHVLLYSRRTRISGTGIGRGRIRASTQTKSSLQQNPRRNSTLQHNPRTNSTLQHNPRTNSTPTSQHNSQADKLSNGSIYSTADARATLQQTHVHQGTSTGKDRKRTSRSVSAAAAAAAARSAVNSDWSRAEASS